MYVCIYIYVYVYVYVYIYIYIGILHNAASMDGSLSGKKTITWEQEEHTIAAIAKQIMVATNDTQYQQQH